MNNTGAQRESQPKSNAGTGPKADTDPDADGALARGMTCGVDDGRNDGEPEPTVSNDDSLNKRRTGSKRFGRRAPRIANALTDSDVVGVRGADGLDSEQHGQRGGKQVKRRTRFAAVLAFAVLPALGLGSGAAASYLKWRDATARASQSAAIESTAAATESTVAILAYEPGTVRTSLTGARDRLAGGFRDAYTKLINDVVIPGAEQKKITTLVTVPGAASLSATPNHAVVLVFVNQNVTMGNEAPTDTASTVKVTLDKVGDRWLISAFDPI